MPKILDRYADVSDLCQSDFFPPVPDDFLNGQRGRLEDFYRRVSFLEAALMDAVIATHFMLVTTQAAPAIDKVSRTWQEAVGRDLVAVGQRLGALVRMTDAFASLLLAEQCKIALTPLTWPVNHAGR